MQKIEIKGKKYPLALRMGTMRRYQELTGESISKMGTDEIKSITFLYCSLLTGCALEKKEVPVTEEEFADLITPEEFAQLADTLSPKIGNPSNSTITSKKK